MSPRRMRRRACCCARCKTLTPTPSASCSLLRPPLIHKEADAFMKRVKTVTKRVFRKYGVVLQPKDALRNDEAQQIHAAGKAAKFGQAIGTASSTLELACAEASAAKKRFECYSHPHRILRDITARWETEPRGSVSHLATMNRNARRGKL